MSSLPSRSAIVRATRKILSCARAERPNSVIEAFDRVAALIVQGTKLPRLPVRHVGVVTHRRTVQAGRLPRTGRRHLAAHLGAGRARLIGRELAEGDGRHLNVDVDPIHQRPAIVFKYHIR